MADGVPQTLALRAANHLLAGERKRNQTLSDSAERGGGPMCAFSDEALVEALLTHGHRQHAEALLERYREKVFHIVLSVLGPRQQEEAQDLAQEICIRLLNKLGQYRRESRFSTWVYRLAFNVALDYERKRKRILENQKVLHRQPLPESTTPAKQLTQEQNERQVQLAVADLPQTQRITIQMFYWLEIPVAEIAELLGTGTNTIKSHLRRGRTRLAQLLDEAKHER